MFITGFGVYEFYLLAIDIQYPLGIGCSGVIDIAVDTYQAFRTRQNRHVRLYYHNFIGIYFMRDTPIFIQPHIRFCGNSR